ncbi:MAG: 3-isopropylmalate dehydratase large subunit [Lentisphaerae bacterium]|nr:3-isopropylmalate dehydratase large subunit [Lentisphaerota bacterium]MBT5606146.1 3-isopropylmalate dehydratase large subunit [Lentisphaerota bacterium]MBT7056365.1 3-isopropylmalate dehydratase large subunit [Lentisphaerota bacterium]MBT7842959.1 3-isopropylmalate dehydratase large subunit [Lentisphaerota bacterium]
MGKSLFAKVWDAHEVQVMPNGQSQLLIGLHLIHEVTSPQAFGMLRERRLDVPYPGLTFATVDHIVPTTNLALPWEDAIAQKMYEALQSNCSDFGITYFGPGSGNQGIVHVVGPEQGLTRPGLTIACGDSHTATHGAFGTIAFGIGTTQVRDVLATQTMAIERPRLRRINVDGALQPGVTAKDIILHIIKTLGVKGGVGSAYEYGGTTIEALSMEERMSICNMSIEGGARCGYINPDDVTFEFLKGRPHSPTGPAWEEAVAKWRKWASDPDAEYNDVVNFAAEDIEPTVTWGITPGQGIGISKCVPSPDTLPEAERDIAEEALAHTRFIAGHPLKGQPVDVCFIGSCTNGRLSDFRAAARLLKGRKVKAGVRALAVPGSEQVDAAARAEGLDVIFREAGFEWRLPGCSMCLAMNPDKLVGDQVCASSSNRNFIGRQGSATGRTVLMSPLMVVAAAITGAVADVREVCDVKTL